MELKIEASDVDAKNFENKRKMIFDCLNSASEKIIGTTLEQKSSPSPEKRHRPQHEQDHRIEAKKFHGKESIFKRPIAPIAKCLKPRHPPDYQINPHKWKMYSLSDADTSDKSNTQAAFTFLKEIEDRKSETEVSACGDNDQGGKIMFNTRKRVHTSAKFNQSIHLKTVVNDDSIDPVLDSPKMRGSKVIMPEYVIGQRKERKKSSGKGSKVDAVKKPTETLKLEHLFEEEDDE